MKAEILEKIYEENKKGKDAALIFLIENRGATPGEENSLMAVFKDGSTLGTIGGGVIEADVIRKSLEGMQKGKSFEFEYKTSDKSDSKGYCGEGTRGFVKYFKSQNRIVIFGAGHVSQKLARIAVKSNFYVIVTDDRREFENAKDFEKINEYICEDIEKAVEKIEFDREKTYIVVCTRSHALDQKVVSAVLDKDYRYLGMIGSKKKIDNIFNSLTEEGFSREKLEKIYAPIGLDIANGSAEEIAIAIMAEILAVKNNLSGKIQKLY